MPLLLRPLLPSAPPLSQRQCRQSPRHSQTFPRVLSTRSRHSRFRFPKALWFSHLREAFRAQWSSDVIFLRCVDDRLWKGELLRCPSPLSSGCRSSGIMALSLWKGLVGIGLFALAHAAFSAAQRKCLGDADRSGAGPRGRRVGAPQRECQTEGSRKGH